MKRHRGRLLKFETEICWFALVGALDVFLTYLLLRFSSQGLTHNMVIESNPVARWVLQQWGFNGLGAFKAVMIVLVVVIAESVGRARPGVGRGLLIVGTLIVGAVVVYSARMLAANTR